METKSHTWSFSSVGGVKRVNLESGADLIHLDQLDQKLWTALSCPVDGLEIDGKTLALIDADHDGQIRVPEVLAAVRWITSVIINPDEILKGEKSLKLSSVNDQTETGSALKASAKTILKNLGKENADSISAEDTADIQKIFHGTRFNGDGVITEDTPENPELSGLIREIIACEGSCPDRSGKPGIHKEILDRFMENAKTYAGWFERSFTEKEKLLPYAGETENAFRIYQEVESKIDDYFIRCRLAAFDPPSADTLNSLISRTEAIRAKNLSECMKEIAEYPLAKIDPAKPLPLTEGINPAWEDRITAFRKIIVDTKKPPKTALSEPEWKAVKESFRDYIGWQSDKPETTVASLGYERIKSILENPMPAQLTDLIQQDFAMEKEAMNIFLVDQLVRYYRDIITLLNNFVTFYDFYSPDRKAVFEAGTLFIDQRSCDLCIRVRDMAKHAVMVSYSGIYLIYCDCLSRKTQKKMTIVAALTNGDVDNIVTGRNGVFYDRNGLDWDATIIKIVENPISIRQAFWTPYRKVSQMIEKQINKAAAAQDEKTTAAASKNIEEAPSKITPASGPAKPPAAPFDLGKFMGIFAAIGLAIGAIGTALASLLTGFLGLVWWKMPIAALGILLAISGPSMIIASLKLRKRNIAPLLDANGWAINARATVNIPFGRTLTHLAKLPKGARINLNDPFTKKKRPLLPILIILFILTAVTVYCLWHFGIIHSELLDRLILSIGKSE